jgi:DnaJ-class molecular chaperone
MTYDNWKTTNPADEFLGPEPEEEECPLCSCCNGTGVVNPLTAPPGFFCVSVDDCPLCDGTGEVL